MIKFLVGVIELKGLSHNTELIGSVIDREVKMITKLVDFFFEDLNAKTMKSCKG